MVTMKWALDEQGRPISAWKTEAPAETQTKVFGAGYRKAVRPATTARPVARRPLRTLALLAATTVVK